MGTCSPSPLPLQPQFNSKDTQHLPAGLLQGVEEWYYVLQGVDGARVPILLLVLLILQVLELEGNAVTSKGGNEAPQPPKCLVGFKVLHNSYSGFLASTFSLPCYDLSLVWRPWHPRFASSDFDWVHREAAQMFPGT